jgi:hypothetical protein
MPETTHDVAKVRLEGRLPRRPQDLPHGLLKPPQEVIDALAREKAKFPPEIYSREVEERTLNEWTVDYLFGHQLGYFEDILYRPTPEGPEVVAVGTVPILAFTKDMAAEDRAKLKTWTPT